MHATDLSILRHLLREGRATWADLAVDLALTGPSLSVVVCWAMAPMTAQMNGLCPWRSIHG